MQLKKISISFRRTFFYSLNCYYQRTRIDSYDKIVFVAHSRHQTHKQLSANDFTFSLITASTVSFAKCSLSCDRILELKVVIAILNKSSLNFSARSPSLCLGISMQAYHSSTQETAKRWTKSHIQVKSRVDKSYYLLIIDKLFS